LTDELWPYVPDKTVSDDIALKERYWLQDPLELPARIAAAVAQNPARGEAFTIGTSFSGRPLPAARFGNGPQRVLLVGAVHGWETITTYSLFAFLDTLFSGVGIDGEDLSTWVQEIAASHTIYFAPQISPDLAVRMHREMPEGFFPNRVGIETEADRELYIKVLGDPYEYFTGEKIAGRFHGFTPEQVAEWKGMGNELGLRWSDQGLDIWMDWERFDSPESRALRDFTLEVAPDCILEMHGYEGPMFLTAPVPLTPAHLEQRSLFFGREMLAAHRRTGLPMEPEPINPYITPEPPFYPNWVHKNLETLFLFGELQMYRNRFMDSQRRSMEGYDLSWMPTQGQIIRSGWTLYRRLIELGQTHGYK